MHAARILCVALLCCGPLGGLSGKSSIDDDLVLSIPYSDVFVATNHIKNILNFIKRFDSVRHARPLHCLDLFAGGGTVASTFCGEGFMSRAVDVKLGGPSHDILTVEGFSKGKCGYV